MPQSCASESRSRYWLLQPSSSDSRLASTWTDTTVSEPLPLSDTRTDIQKFVSMPPGSPGTVHDDPGSNAEDLTPRLGRPKVAAYQIFEASESNLKDTRQRILQETAGHYIGPMPVTEFLHEFMSWNKEVPETWKEVKVTQEQLDAIVTLPQCSEAQLYTQFVSHS